MGRSDGGRRVLALMLATTLGGSALGMLAAAGLVRVGNWRYDADRRACDVLCWTLGAVVVALPGVGATVLYNESRR
ncbi:MAG: hypothetical protein IPF98_02650 [Gemmatimonadetes bacterium]|nr:hypothetical protein [Gemmatimonadota bacterium]